MHMKCMDTDTKQLGGTLIEVLISIALSAIGLLALAGVNAASIQYAQMAQYRSTAAFLANDFAERMRANKAGYTADNYEFNTEFQDQVTAAPVVPAMACGVFIMNPVEDPIPECSPAELADADLYQWRVMVASQLPSGAVFVARDAANNGADVYIAWRESQAREKDDGTNDERPEAASECPAGLTIGAEKYVRCFFYRVHF